MTSGLGRHSILWPRKLLTIEANTTWVTFPRSSRITRQFDAVVISEQRKFPRSERPWKNLQLPERRWAWRSFRLRGGQESWACSHLWAQCLGGGTTSWESRLGASYESSFCPQVDQRWKSQSTVSASGLWRPKARLNWTPHHRHWQGRHDSAFWH